MLNEYAPVFTCVLCRVQYPISHQTNLIAALSNVTSSGAASQPVLLQANAFISDIIHLSFSSDIDPSAVLDMATAVAAAPVSHTGFGLHLMVAPVVEALQQLTRFNTVSIQLFWTSCYAHRTLIEMQC